MATSANMVRLLEGWLKNPRGVPISYRYFKKFKLDCRKNTGKRTKKHLVKASELLPWLLSTRHRNLLGNWTRVHSHERTSVEPPLKMAKNTCTIHASVKWVILGSSSKCSKARITVLPCQVVPSTPCLSWSLFGPSFCYCSAPWYSH